MREGSGSDTEPQVEHEREVVVFNQVGGQEERNLGASK